MPATIRFQDERPGRVSFNRLQPPAFVRGVRSFLDSLPPDPKERGKRVLDLLRQDDGAIASRLFGVEPIAEQEIARYALREGDHALAAMARRALAQAWVAALGMNAAVDSLEFRETIDFAGLASRVQNFGHYMLETQRLREREIAQIGSRFAGRRFGRVVLPGAMGGSAMGADAVKMLLANLGFEAPLEVLPHYPHPTRPLRADDLVVLYSYSGNTEEALLWVEPAEACGARIVGVAAGGQLETICRDKDWPWLEIPGAAFHLAQPREHLPVSIMLLLQLIGRLDLARRMNGKPFSIDEWGPRINATASRLSEFAASTYNVELPFEGNVAKQAALFLNWGARDPAAVANIMRLREPVFWASSFYEAVVRRMENQFGECVEKPAPAKVMPEDMHNEQEAFVGSWMETLWPVGEAAGIEGPKSEAVHLRFVGPLDDRLNIRAAKLFDDFLEGSPRLTFEIRDYGPEFPMLGELEAFLFCDLTRAFASIFRGVTPHLVHSMNYNKHYMASLAGSPGSTGKY